MAVVQTPNIIKIGCQNICKISATFLENIHKILEIGGRDIWGGGVSQQET